MRLAKEDSFIDKASIRWILFSTSPSLFQTFTASDLPNMSITRTGCVLAEIGFFENFLVLRCGAYVALAPLVMALCGLL